MRWTTKSVNDTTMGLAFSTPAAGWSWGGSWQASVVPADRGCTLRIGGSSRISSTYNITANSSEGKRLARLLDRVGVHVAAMLEADPSGGLEPPREATAGAVSVADELAKLGQLRAEGLLSDEEFAAAKARLLGSR
jgi:hypothetical protein